MTGPVHPAMGTLSAVIPAAGFSMRMHQYKPLLKFGDTPMIEKVITLFQACGIKDILVVTGHNRDMLTPLIRKNGAVPVFNPDFETGMFSSIQKGAACVSSESSGFFLLPVDIPLVRVSTVHALLTAFKNYPEKIIIPEFEKTPGHPPLIPAKLIPGILEMDLDANLGELLLSQKNDQVRCPVHDRGILLDADTKEDYGVLAEKYRHLDIPDRQECWSIIHEALPGETQIQSHLALVAEIAVKLGQAVKQGMNRQTPDSGPDLALIQAAALLHDIRRKEKNHARAGSRYLCSLGFPRVADIVAEHMTLEPGHGLTEKEIVYFADKLCNGTRVEIDFAKRFEEKIKQAPDARTMILKRHEDCRHIQARIEAAAGRSIRTLLE